MLPAACHLLGEYGDETHKNVLRRIINNSGGYFREEALVALEQITSREEAGAGRAQQARSTSDVRAAPTLDRDPAQRQNVADAIESQEAEEETKMMLALRMDEAEVLEQESADVAEAILRSNIDAASAAGSQPDEESVTHRYEDCGASKNVESVPTSSTDGGPMSSVPSAPSSGVTDVLPGRASLQAVTPLLVDECLPSIGTVAHDNDCIACRSKARGKVCKFGVGCKYCHGPHSAAKASSPGGRSRQRGAKRRQASSWFRPPTPDPFDEP